MADVTPSHTVTKTNTKQYGSKYLSLQDSNTAAKIDNGTPTAASALKRQQSKCLNHATSTKHEHLSTEPLVQEEAASESFRITSHGHEKEILHVSEHAPLSETPITP